MKGFPSRLTRNAFGPTYRNAARVTRPDTDFDANIFNLALRQIAGMNGLSPRGFASCEVASNVVSVRRRWLAWDPNGALPLGELAFVRASAGVYTWAFGSTSYPDMDGEQILLNLEGVVPVYQGAANFNMVGQVGTNGASGSLNAFNQAGAAADVFRFLVWFV